MVACDCGCTVSLEASDNSCPVHEEASQWAAAYTHSVGKRYAIGRAERVMSQVPGVMSVADQLLLERKGVSAGNGGSGSL